MAKTGKAIRFMSTDKITKDLFNQYKSAIVTAKIGNFDEFISLYNLTYNNAPAIIIRGPYLWKNNNYYVTIFAAGEERMVYYELIKHFTNIKFRVTLDESLFTL